MKEDGSEIAVWILMYLEVNVELYDISHDKKVVSYQLGLG